MERSQITSTLASSLIADQFPEWADLTVSPVDPPGWDNVTFRLGDGLTIRMPSAAAYAGQVAKEQRWLPIMRSQLPLRIPEPVALGLPGRGYPWSWSVYRWLAGAPVSSADVSDLSAVASSLAIFLGELRCIDAHDAPEPGAHNFFRGGSLATYDAEARAAIRTLMGRADTGGLTAVWDAALTSRWNRPPVWVHGDVSPNNLLAVDGLLDAVIDWGCMAGGDPACDLTIAWTLFHGDSRQVFRSEVALDDEMWARARGWAAWKALITVAASPPGGDDARNRFGWRVDASTILTELVAEHRRSAVA